jgi:hypothetical protein
VAAERVDRQREQHRADGRPDRHNAVTEERYDVRKVPCRDLRRRTGVPSRKWHHVDASPQLAPSGDLLMHTLGQVAYLDSSFGSLSELPHAGSALENPFVYDDSAREIKALAERGLVEIVVERTMQFADERLISHLTFRRLR